MYKSCHTCSRLRADIIICTSSDLCFELLGSCISGTVSLKGNSRNLLQLFLRQMWLRFVLYELIVKNSKVNDVTIGITVAH